MTPDTINALFEILGFVFVGINVRKIWHDKLVRGAHWVPMAFFTSWGYWNMYYYPSLEQWWSFWGAFATAFTNTAYLTLLIYYTQKESKDANT